ncbi:FMR1-interacting protein NUFIP1 [Ochlerotatus camptorhynchus]|uniref:FMR1-interacting protein NUFIP1 n=1 Tax=Ochlerotatus camptorhynchus TaxID=644619 RepID=UPI0031DC0B58
MANPEKIESFRLPPPKFGADTKKSLDNFNKLRNPHFSTPSGMLLPRDNQPPPMYGPRGSTVPPWLVNRPQQHNYGSKGPTNHHQRSKGPHRGHSSYSNGGFEKDVIPELLEVNWYLWCEKCDVNCRTEDELQKHLSEHRSCEVEGCKYVGHPWVMKRHWKLVHDEQKLQEKAHMESKQSPEDIDKWRAERRIRYPSKNNILRRQREQEEKFKRGERIEEDKKRFPNKKHQEPRNDKQRNFRGSAGKQRYASKKPKIFKDTVEEHEDSDEDTKSRISFKGTSKLKDYKEEDTNSLSLLCGYGSDSGECSSEEEPEPEPIPDSTTKAGTIQNELETIMPAETIASSTSNLSDGEVVDSETEQDILNDVKVQEKCTTEVDDGEVKNENNPESKPPNEETKTKRKNRTRKRRNGGSQDEPSSQPGPSKITRIEKPLLNYSKLRHARQNTLLEKLLEPDIRHERNVLLQCVRFVVQKGFFGIGQPKTSASEQSDYLE